VPGRFGDVLPPGGHGPPDLAHGKELSFPQGPVSSGDSAGTSGPGRIRRLGRLGPQGNGVVEVAPSGGPMAARRGARGAADADQVLPGGKG
jgi:hypothetical protein